MRGPTEARMEQLIGAILRTGVSVAATLILLGGLQFLVRHGSDPADQAFRDVPSKLRPLAAIARDAAHPGGRALIQLGLVVLVATPVARVAFSLVAFAVQGDRKFVVITLVVLAILAVGLVGPS